MEKLENYQLKKLLKKTLKPYIKMDPKTIKFDDTDIEEFYQYESFFSIKNIDTNGIVVTNKFLIGKQDFKYFIGYKGTIKTKPLCIFFLETNVYRIDLKQTECMSLLEKDKKSLEKYNEIWEKG